MFLGEIISFVADALCQPAPVIIWYTQPSCGASLVGVLRRENKRHDICKQCALRLSTKTQEKRFANPFCVFTALLSSLVEHVTATSSRAPFFCWHAVEEGKNTLTIPAAEPNIKTPKQLRLSTPKSP